MSWQFTRNGSCLSTSSSNATDTLNGQTFLLFSATTKMPITTFGTGSTVTEFRPFSCIPVKTSSTFATRSTATGTPAGTVAFSIPIGSTSESVNAKKTTLTFMKFSWTAISSTQWWTLNQKFSQTFELNSQMVSEHLQTEEQQSESSVTFSWPPMDQSL